MNKFTTFAIAGATLVAVAAMGVQSAEAGSRKNFGKGFVAGAIAGAIIAGSSRSGRGHDSSYDPAPRYSARDAHIDWCYDNRPRYNPRNNTFRYSGQPRQTCYSPYN